MSVHKSVRDGVTVLTITSPPVNALSLSVRESLYQHFLSIRTDPSVRAVVLAANDVCFSGGADITEFERSSTQVSPAYAKGPVLHDLIDFIEAGPVPVVAAIHGYAYGGGLELALGAHFRIVSKGTKLGLPEVTLGIIPGAGGTQRLPRLIGLQKSLEMIVSGVPVSITDPCGSYTRSPWQTNPLANPSKRKPLIDLVVNSSNVQDLVNAAVSLALHKSDVNLHYHRCSNLAVPPSPLGAGLFEIARMRAAKQMPGYLAPLCCIDAVEWASTSTFNDGMKKERDIVNRAIASPQASAMQHFFFAQRKATKLTVPPHVSSDVTPQTIRSVGVIGAGTMGQGIAILLLSSSVNVVLLDASDEQLSRAVPLIRKSVLKHERRRRPRAGATEEDEKEMLRDLGRRMVVTTDYEKLSDVDLVIEAVYENIALKKIIFQKIDRICKPSALLCTNTSTLDVDVIASSTQRREQCMGMHFFSPANVMRLIELVKSSHTSFSTLMSVLNFAKSCLRKVPVVVRNCHGFVGNRMIAMYGKESLFLLEEGSSVKTIDECLESFGWRMGPFRMGDLAGNDVGFRIRQQMGVARSDEVPSQDVLRKRGNERYSELGDRLCELGRYGQKTKKGWYAYGADGRSAQDDPVVDELVDSYRKERGFVPRHISDDEIRERMILPLINEGFRILEEGIAQRASDIDVIFCLGYGFPPWRGGPMFYASKQGLRSILDRLRHYAALFPHSSHFNVHSDGLLSRLVERGLSLEDFDAGKMRDGRTSRL